MVPFVRDKSWIWLVMVTALAPNYGVRAQRYQVVGEDAMPQAAADAEQVVVLRDGGVMFGRVTQNGERYVVARGSGEIFIPANKVMLVAASLEDAYQQRRKKLADPTAENHLILAEWCLRQNLFDFAEAELGALRALEPRHDKLKRFERRLALAKEHEQRKAEVIARVATDSPEAPTPVPTSTNVGDVPSGTVERFTRKVQPVLVNSCTTSGCHELGGTTRFQLDRSLLRGMSNQRTTMNNLAATLTLVDREQPQQSLLLTVPRRTHGGMKGPVFGPRREAAFRHLYEWVALVTAETAKPLPAAQPAENIRTASSDTEQGATDGSVPAVYQEHATDTDGQGSETEPASPANAAIAQSPLRYGAQLKHWQPRDPFDPEVFNRKYAPPEGSASAVQTAE